MASRDAADLAYVAYVAYVAYAPPDAGLGSAITVCMSLSPRPERLTSTI